MRGNAEVEPGRSVSLVMHSSCAVAALIFVFGVLAGAEVYVRCRLPGKMAAFAARPSPIKLTGNILQTEAFRLPATLPIYGSSELDRPAANRPDEFFRDRPTGFSAFPVGRGGTTCLMILQKVAAVGREARGKKAVIFLSPSWFAKESVGDDAVGANLTSPQLSAWLFGSGLSLPLRQRIVSRLLDYPGSLEDQMLLDTAVRCLAEPTSVNRAFFAVLRPLGCIQNGLFRRIEYCAILREMLLLPVQRVAKRGYAVIPTPRVASGELDWTRLAADAEAEDRAKGDGAYYSATNALLPEKRRAEHIRAQTPGSRDEEFAARIKSSKEFGDLQLLIEVLKELGVDAMFVSQPFNGLYRDLGGTTRRSRQVYYDKLAKVLARAGYPLVEFNDHEEDRFFFNDANHPSGKAWILYNQGINGFYHGTRG